METVDVALSCWSYGLALFSARSEAQPAPWVAVTAKTIIYLLAFIVPAVILLSQGSKRPRPARTAAADGAWSAGSIRAAGAAVLAGNSVPSINQQLALNGSQVATSGCMQQLGLDSNLVVSSRQQGLYVLPPEVSLRDWKGRSTTGGGITVSGGGLRGSMSAADDGSSPQVSPQGHSLGWPQPIPTRVACSSPDVHAFIPLAQPDYSMSDMCLGTPSPGMADEFAAAVVSPDVMLGIPAVCSLSPAITEAFSSWGSYGDVMLAPVPLPAAAYCATASCETQSHECDMCITSTGHTAANTAAAEASCSSCSMLMPLSTLVAAGEDKPLDSRGASCWGSPQPCPLLHHAMQTPFGVSSYYPDGQQWHSISLAGAEAAGVQGSVGVGSLQQAPGSAGAAAAAAGCVLDSSRAAPTGVPVLCDSPCQQYPRQLVPPAAAQAAMAAAAALLLPTPPELTINTGRRKLSTEPQQQQHHQQQRQEESAFSSPAAMASEGSIDQPSTPVFVSTTSRTLRHPAGKTPFSNSGFSCSSSSTSVVSATPPPLPSPAGSPLARRVTNDRDDNGVPTSPGLLQLIQQQDEDALGGDGEQQQHQQQQVPWAGLQLRSVSQKTCSVACSSCETGAVGCHGCGSGSRASGSRASSSSSGSSSAGASSLGTNSSVQTVDALDAGHRALSISTGTGHVCSRDDSDSCLCNAQAVVQPCSCSSSDCAAISFTSSEPTPTGKGQKNMTIDLINEGSKDCTGPVSIPYQQLLAFYEAGFR